MEFLQTFVEGHNVIFTVPILFVVLFVLMQVVGFNLDHLVGAGADADADVDVGVDADVDADVDVGVDADADVDVDADADADAGGIEGAGHGIFLDALAFFNLGKVPLMILVELMFITFGMTGVVFNFYGVEKLPFFEPWMRMGVTGPLAAIAAVLVTKTLSELMAAYMPTTGQQALKSRDLEGRIGEVVSVRLDEKYGRVVVIDPTGQVQMVHCMMMEKEPAVQKGGRVVLVSFDPKTNIYMCSAASSHSA